MIRHQREMLNKKKRAGGKFQRTCMIIGEKLLNLCKFIEDIIGSAFTEIFKKNFT
jgi:hypothetical protein